MLRSIGFALATLSAAAIVAAQAPAQDRPPVDRPAAQQPAPKPAPATPQPSTQAPSPQRPMQAISKVTYIGCVKPGTTEDAWLLENAELAPKTSASGEASTPAPAPSAVATAGGKLTFNLDPAAGVNLKSHANHKVELIGTVSPAKSSSPGAAASSSTPERQQFRVESLKMVAATCP